MQILINALKGAAQFVLAKLAELFLAMWLALVTVFQWCIDIPWQAVNYFMNLLLVIPGIDQSAVLGAINWLEIANYWFPIQEGFAAITFKLAFDIVFIGFKYVIKAIPLVG